ncbi:MAG: hypothetical protein ABII18_09170 [bacterium]|nr:hypothetical protein [bacterium]MBU1916940.1 hypothetical protein [bacterium]
MSSWRDRLCGSPVSSHGDEASDASMRQYTKPSESMSCGGGHYPANINIANMNTFRGTFVLPTKDYAVLIFREDGSAVIYTDTEEAAIADDVGSDDGSLPSV